MTKYLVFFINCLLPGIQPPLMCDLSVKKAKMIEQIEQRRLQSAGIGSVSCLQDQLLCEEIYNDKFGKAFCLPGQNLQG